MAPSPTHAPVETATRWATQGPGLVVVTRGGDGAVAVRPDGTTLEVPGVPVVVADTVGAGDTFSGVLIDTLLALGVSGAGGADALRALTDRDVLERRDDRRDRRRGHRLPSRCGPARPRRAHHRPRRLRSARGVSAEQIHDIGKRRAWVIWLVALAVYVLAVFHRSSLGVAGIIAAERFDISATSLATFTVLQLVVYAGMQVPVGVLLDRFGSRAMLVCGLVLMTAGQLGFAFSDSFAGAVASRAVVGAGDAMVFVSVIRLVTAWFLVRQGPMVTQLTGLTGQLGAIAAAGPLSYLLHALGWTRAFALTSSLGVVLLVAVLARGQGLALPPRRRGGDQAACARPVGAHGLGQPRHPAGHVVPLHARSSPSPSSRCCGDIRSSSRDSGGPRPAPARC